MAFGKKKVEERIEIQPANLVRTTIRIKGLTPLLQNKFPNKAVEAMLAAMSTKKSDKKAKTERAVRDYDQDFLGAQHISTAGWNGLPCAAFRSAMIRACSLVGIEMTKGKMALFVIADGFDAAEGTPLVRIQSKKGPERSKLPARLKNGSFDIRVRPIWKEWFCDVTVEFDSDIISPQSIVNLLDRAGRQVGVGEGRPFSRDSAGMGLGTFCIDTTPEKKKAKK